MLNIQRNKMRKSLTEFNSILFLLLFLILQNFHFNVIGGFIEVPFRTRLSFKDLGFEILRIYTTRGDKKIRIQFFCQFLVIFR